MEEPICRICLESEEPLISPCLCNGTMKYVHETCLNRWRFSKMHTLSFSQCDQCHYIYQFYSDMSFLYKSVVTCVIYICMCIITGYAIHTFMMLNEYIVMNLIPYHAFLIGCLFFGFYGYFLVHPIFFCITSVIAINEYMVHTLLENKQIMYTIIFIGTLHVFLYIYTSVSRQNRMRIKNK